MRRRMLGMAVAGVLVVSLASAVHAQSRYSWVGVAATVPVGDSKDAMKTGWMGDVGMGFPLMGSKKTSLQLGGLYGSNDAKVGSGSSTFYAVYLNVGYTVNPDAKISPYGYLGGGILGSKPEGGSSDTNGAYQVGAGLAYTVNPKCQFWGEARYLGSGSGNSKLTLMPITIGLTYIYTK